MKEAALSAAIERAEKLAFVYAFASGFQCAEKTSRSCISAIDDAWAKYQEARLAGPPAATMADVCAFLETSP